LRFRLGFFNDFRVCDKCAGETAVLLDYFIDFAHEPDSLFDGHDNFLVMLDIFVSESAAPPVFEPFFADLVSADVEIPDVGGDVFKTGFVGINEDGAGFVFGVTFGNITETRIIEGDFSRL